MDAVNDYQDHLYALVIVGGGGTRLWPKSRNKTPKQFLRLFKKQTLTQITISRLSKFIPWEKIFVVTTTKEYKDEILAEVPQLIASNVIYEPLRRNTAPAHGLGAIVIAKKDPDAVIINSYCDQLIDPEHVYVKDIKLAARVAFSQDVLVTMGIKPTYPNIGYGHIKRGARWDVLDGKTIYEVDKFTEKPPLQLAKKYTASGNYYWNAGQYVWRADTILSALDKHEPKIAKGLKRISEYLNMPEFEKVLLEEYEKMPEISIDYAVSEKAKNFLIVPADYRWTDIGDWKEVWENLPKDAQGNVIVDGDEEGGRVINIDTSDAIIHTDGRLVAIIDVDNVVVVDTKDALLICSKSRAQNVKKIVEKLKEEKEVDLL